MTESVRPPRTLREVRTCRRSWFTDLLLGGLNYQIEHHLFPNMPRASLRHAQQLIRSHCDNLGITYTESSLIGSYVAALRHLNRLGKTATHLNGRPRHHTKSLGRNWSARCD